jgi:AraC-like DNA-binding protein
MALLYLGIGRALFLGTRPLAAMHTHKTLELALSLDLPLAYRTAATPWRSARGVAIAPGVPHQIRLENEAAVSILLVAEKRWTPFLKEGLFSGGPIQVLDRFDLSEFHAFFADLLKREADCSEVFAECELLVERIAGIGGFRGRVDQRLLRVLDVIERDLPRRVHSEELGLPLRQYVLHQRICRATRSILTGASATQAAIDAGFADSAHFTRTFFRLTGMCPSQLKPFRGRVRVFSCGSPYCVRPTTEHPQGGACAHCGLYAGDRVSF